VEAASESGTTVTLPVEVPVSATSESAPAINISVPSGVGRIKVEIPVTNVTPSTVAVIVYADGTEEIVKTSSVTENGVALNLSSDVTVKIIDNSKDFSDVADDHWAGDSIAFVASRELFKGTSSVNFNPEAATTRAQLMTVLARLNGMSIQATSEGTSWAVENGISDGSDPDSNISRQQLAVMLYRYAGEPETNGSLTSFSDADSASAYASAALAWAVENGIITGTTTGKLDPQGAATRAQVAAMIARYVSTIG
jgi:hypothetical protein